MVGGTYPDTGGRTLVDGELGAPEFWDPAWVGLQSERVGQVHSILFDLRRLTQVGSVRLHVLNDLERAISVPGRVDVLLSRDGHTWSSPHSLAIAQDGITPSVRWYTVDGLDEKARYVRIDLTAAHEWIFISEVEVLPPQYPAMEVDVDPGAVGRDVVELTAEYLPMEVPEHLGRYPSPEEAGIHHVALVNDVASGDGEALKPYLVRYIDGSPTDEWLFDAFLLWRQVTASGKRTEYGTTNQADWEELMDQWLLPGGDLDTLDTAIAEVAREVGVDRPPSRRKVILSIPWLNPEVRQFGDIDGDGVRENLAIQGDRERVLRWFVHEAVRRFEAAGYQHLDLWGFYWMREDIVTDPHTVRAAARQIHEADLKLLWIPYYMAPGWDTWWEYGIDVAIMQPSYAFRSWLDGGRVRKDRLAATAHFAQEHGMGVEIEIRGRLESPAEKRMFLHYLHGGSAGQHGYQFAPTAYFLGRNFIEYAYDSEDPGLRLLYQALADYITGNPVADPDTPLAWTWHQAADGTVIAEAHWDEPESVPVLEIYLEEPPTAYWRGSITVLVQERPGGPWEDAGWLARAVIDSLGGMWQSVAVPVGRDAVGLRVMFSPQVDSPPLNVTQMLIDQTGPTWVASDARGVAYTVSPERPVGQYPDRGRMLTDGNVSTSGYTSGLNVGWMLDPGELSISLDLGTVQNVREVELYCQGGHVAGVNWPLNPLALFSVDRVVQTPEGLGAFPKGLSYVSGSEPVIDREHSPWNLDGRIVFTPQHPVEARFVTIFTESKGWTMCSEVRVYVEDQDAPLANVSYMLRPVPNSLPIENSYPDDGRRLTDGVIVHEFLPYHLTGWEAPVSREVVISLDKAALVRSLTLWAVQDPHYAVYGPREVAFAYSDDGVRWNEAGVARRGFCSSGTVCALPYRVTLSQPVRASYVKATVYPSVRWTMISEFVVESLAAEEVSGDR